MKARIKRLDEIIKILEEVDVTPVLWAGSLLGAVREQGAIKGDSDIDLAYLSAYEDPKKVHSECIEIYKKLGDYVLDYFDQNWKKHYDKDYVSVFGQAHIGWKEAHFDLFTLWKDDKFMYDPWFGGISEPTQEVVKDSLEYEGGKYNGFTEPEKILTSLYGDWKTPKAEKGTKYNKFGFQLKSLRGVV